MRFVCITDHHVRWTGTLWNPAIEPHYGIKGIAKEWFFCYLSDKRGQLGRKFRQNFYAFVHMLYLVYIKWFQSNSKADLYKILRKERHISM